MLFKINFLIWNFLSLTRSKQWDKASKDIFDEIQARTRIERTSTSPADAGHHHHNLSKGRLQSFIDWELGRTKDIRCFKTAMRHENTGHRVHWRIPSPLAGASEHSRPQKNSIVIGGEIARGFWISSVSTLSLYMEQYTLVPCTCHREQGRAFPIHNILRWSRQPISNNS